MDDHPLDVFDSTIPTTSVDLPSQRETDGAWMGLHQDCYAGGISLLGICPLVAFLCWASAPWRPRNGILTPRSNKLLGHSKSWPHDIPNPAKMPLPLCSNDSGPCSLIPMLSQGPQPYLPLHRPGSLNQELPSLPHHTKGSGTSASGFLGSAHHGSADAISG